MATDAICYKFGLLVAYLSKNRIDTLHFRQAILVAAAETSNAYETFESSVNEPGSI
jgi:hypothetical protein